MLPSFLNRFSYFMNLWWCLWSFSVDIPDTEIYSTSFRYNRFANSCFPQHPCCSIRATGIKKCNPNQKLTEIFYWIQNLQLVILYLFFQRSLWVHQHFLANHKSNPRVNFNCWIYGQKVWALSSCSDTPFWNSFTMKNWLVVFMESKHIEKQPAPT
jgi:hypothetical protein